MVALPLYAIAIMHTDDLCELAQKELTRARALALARGWLSRLIELKLCQHDCDQDRLPQLLLHAQRDVHAIERSTHRRKPAEVKGRSLPFAKSTAGSGWDSHRWPSVRRHTQRTQRCARRQARMFPIDSSPLDCVCLYCCALC